VVELTEQQRSKITGYVDRFRDRFEHELSGEGWVKERKEREELFLRLLGEDHIFELTEAEFRQVLASLWANQLWTNKDYPADRVLKHATLERVREELYLLLWGDAPIAERYDSFRRSIKGMGPSMITEILCFVRPKDYPIWNEKPKNVLPRLGMKTLLPDKLYKYQISGDDYARIIEVLDTLRREVESQGFPDMDFMDLDIFIWLLFSEVVKAEEEPREKPQIQVITPVEVEIKGETLDHWDAIALLLELGNLLGYDTYASDPSRKSRVLGKTLGDIARLQDIPAFTYERHLDTVKNIDVIWFREEFPSHCFEVEHTTGVTLGLLRLYQIRNFTQAKFFVVSPSNILSKFKAEITKDPFYTVKHRYHFRSYDDLVVFFEEAKRYHRLHETFLDEKAL